MNTLIQLQKRFSQLKEEKDLEFFFIWLNQYFEFIYSKPKLKELLDSIRALENKDYEKANSLEKKALKELEVSERKLKEIIKENGIKSENITGLFKAIDAYKNGKNIFYNEPCETITIFAKEVFIEIKNLLFEIAKELKKTGYKALLREFTTDERTNIYGDYVFSEAYFDAINEREKMAKIEKYKPWYYLHNLEFALDMYKGLSSPETSSYLQHKLEQLKTELGILQLYLEENMVLKSNLVNGNNNRDTARDGDLEIDNNILLRRSCKPNKLLLKREDDGTFAFEKVHKMEGWLMEITFKRRSDKNNRMFHPRKIASEYKPKPAKENSMRNSIKKINDVCSQYGVKIIFCATTNGYFDLNPELDCMKPLRPS